VRQGSPRESCPGPSGGASQTAVRWKGMALEQGALYPLLLQLEVQGFRAIEGGLPTLSPA
jgi:hypothetical protein